MKTALFLAGSFWAGCAAQGGVVSHVWRDSKLALTLQEGFAEVEWITAAAVRVTRNPADMSSVFVPIEHDPVLVAFEDSGNMLRMRSRFLMVEVDRETSETRVRFREDAPVRVVLPSATDVEIHFGPAEKVFGLANFNQPRLKLEGERLNRGNGFLHASNGYGLYLRAPVAWRIDVGAGVARSRDPFDAVIYYGPSPKEILEQHQAVTGLKEVKQPSLAILTPAQIPAAATRVDFPIDSWDRFADFVRMMNHWSLSGIQYPALDLAQIDGSPGAIKLRLLDLAALFPIVLRSTGRASIDRATRDAFAPYFLTYLREGYERGFPLIRALPMQFPLDANSDQHPQEFMLGDEFLLAPVTEPGDRRRLTLPRGNWTDLRTNIQYRGNQNIEVEAPAGRVPMFVRNGSLFPLSSGRRTELHYIPSLGGEFFQWEPSLEVYSQYHAAPAGDFLRVEVESKVARTYEWVLHHTRVPSEVGEDSRMYRRVESRTALRPGTWWHDARRNNLHLMLQAEANSDRIVNVAFPN